MRKTKARRKGSNGKAKARKAPAASATPSVKGRAAKPTSRGKPPSPPKKLAKSPLPASAKRSERTAQTAAKPAPLTPVPPSLPPARALGAAKSAKSPIENRLPGKVPGKAFGKGGKAVALPVAPPMKGGKPVRRMLIQTGKPIAVRPGIATNRDSKRNVLSVLRLKRRVAPHRDIPLVVKPVEIPFEPKSNQAMTRKTSFKKAELQRYQQMLHDKRDSLVGDVRSMESQAFRQSGTESNPNHMADYGSDTFEQDFTLGLIESDEKVILQINLALERIEKQTFGICESCSIDIPLARLEVLPWAAYCVKCQAQAERF